MSRLPTWTEPPDSDDDSEPDVVDRVMSFLGARAAIRRGADHMRRLTDFPLRPETLNRPLDAPLLAFFPLPDELAHRAGGGYLPPPAPVANPQAPTPSTRQGPRQTIVTVSSALEKTSYKEENDKSERSLDYITAQRAALAFLDKNAADSLTAAAARTLTERIGPKNKYPPVSDALRFCYYLRSIGFDTYSQINAKTGWVKLYVISQAFAVRDHDQPYWEQNLKTNKLKGLRDVGYGRGYPRYARRSAVPNVAAGPGRGLLGNLLPADPDFGGLLARMARVPPRDGDETEDADDVNEAAEQDGVRNPHQQLQAIYNRVNMLIDQGGQSERVAQLLERAEVLTAQNRTNNAGE